MYIQYQAFLYDARSPSMLMLALSQHHHQHACCTLEIMPCDHGMVETFIIIINHSIDHIIHYSLISKERSIPSLLISRETYRSWKSSHLVAGEVRVEGSHSLIRVQFKEVT